MKKIHGWAVLALLCAAVAGGTALGQGTPSDPNKKEALKPPTPSKPDDPPLAMTYIGAFLAVGLMGFAALIPSKRGHQD